MLTLGNLIRQHDICFRSYTDATQLCVSIEPDNVAANILKLKTKLKLFYWTLKSNEICSSIRWGHKLTEWEFIRKKVLLHLWKCQDTKLPEPSWKLPSCISRKLSLFIKHCVTDPGDFFKNVSDEQNELPGISLPGWLNTHQQTGLLQCPFLLDFPQKSSLLCSFSTILLQGYANMLDTECSAESLP